LNAQHPPPPPSYPPSSAAGRTARGATGTGRALLFLLPEELGFIKFLRAAKVGMTEYEFPEKKVANVQVRGEAGGASCVMAGGLSPAPPS
jgi:ATP-dependent RNA helicase DDX18/HAS1